MDDDILQSDLDIPIEAWLNREISGESPVLVAGDSRIGPFSQDDGWKRTDTLMQCITSLGEHCPACIGQRFAAFFFNKLERCFSALVPNGRVGELAGINFNISSDDG